MERTGHRALLRDGAFFAIVLCVGLLNTARVFAQHDEARDLFEQGVRALHDSHYEEAVQLFQRSHASRARAASECNLGLAYEQWGNHEVEAAAAYEQCAVEDDSGAFRQHAIERARVLREAAAHRRETATANTANSEHTPEASTPEPAPSPSSVVATSPEATGSTALTSQASAAPRESSHVALWTGIALSGVSVGALIAGAVLALDSQSDSEHLDRKYPDGNIPAEVDGEPNPDITLLHDAQTKSDWSTGLYVAGAIGAAAGATLIVLDLTVLQADAGVAVTPSTEGASVSLRGSF